MDFNYQGARESGYSDSEILEHIGSKPDLGFDVKQARESGYSDTELVDYLRVRKPKVKEPSLRDRGTPAVLDKVMPGQEPPSQSYNHSWIK